MDGWIGWVRVVGFEKAAFFIFHRKTWNRGALARQKVCYHYVWKYKDQLVTHSNTHAVLELPGIVADVSTYHTGMIYQSRDAAVVIGNVRSEPPSGEKRGSFFARA